jgi:hypothetical protein
VSAAIGTVMAPGPIEVAFGSGGEGLFLTRGDTTLALVPVAPDPEEPTDTGAGDGTWPDLSGSEGARGEPDRILLERP